MNNENEEGERGGERIDGHVYYYTVVHNVALMHRDAQCRRVRALLCAPVRGEEESRAKFHHEVSHEPQAGGYFRIKASRFPVKIMSVSKKNTLLRRFRRVAGIQRERERAKRLCSQLHRSVQLLHWPFCARSFVRTWCIHCAVYGPGLDSFS